MSGSQGQPPAGWGQPGPDRAQPTPTGRPLYRKKRVLVPAALLAGLIGLGVAGNNAPAPTKQHAVTSFVNATPTAPVRTDAAEPPADQDAAAQQAAQQVAAQQAAAQIAASQAAAQQAAQQVAAQQAAAAQFAASQAAAQQAAQQVAAQQAAAQIAASQAAAQQAAQAQAQQLAVARAAAAQAAADAAIKAQTDQEAAAQTREHSTAPAVPPGDGTYTNSDGNTIPDPVQAPQAPPGATAQCNDGSWSSSQHHSGTCSGHHGVARWL